MMWGSTSMLKGVKPGKRLVCSCCDDMVVVLDLDLGCEGDEIV